MDKNAIKSFAIESRRLMIESVKYQANLIGISKESIRDPSSAAEGMETYDYGAGTYTIFDEDITKRESLVREVKNKGFENVVEEAAYTWFNRIIAIRFMELNDYLPNRVRVLSSETTGKIEPDMIAEAIDLDLDYTKEDRELIFKLKDENNLDDLFQFLFIKQCNKLNDILPGLFEKTEDYNELLLDISFTNENGIIRKLIKEISEEDFIGQVEIIGWLYQYYITDLNNLVYDGSLKQKKIPKELLPFATQIFTPDWVVKYMVDNSLGKLWLDNNIDSNLINNLKYYVEHNSYNTNSSLDVEDIKVIDPCMGSGHILVYVFDVLMNIYKSMGYSSNDAVISILRNNIYGLDIDDRAYQLAYFAIMMKAREYSRRIFNESIDVSLCSIKESNNINLKFVKLIGNKYPIFKEDLEYVIKIFEDAKEYGSILQIKKLDFNKINNIIVEIENNLNSDLALFNYRKDIILLKKLIRQAELLTLKYDIVVTNPPYLNSSRFDSKLSNFVKKYYPTVKSDLSMIMYKKAIEDLSKPTGYISFITTNSWMYLTKFENFRKNILKSIKFESLVDFGSELFEGKVGHNLIVAWVNKNIEPSIDYKSVAIRLVDYNYSNRNMKKIEFSNEKNKYYFNQNDFNNIPGSPMAYWVEKILIDSFSKGKRLDYFSDIKSGLVTGNNDLFLRYWYEVDYSLCNFNTSSKHFKWFALNKGGRFKRWYGNHHYVIDWENDGFNLKNYKKSSIQNVSVTSEPTISWSSVSNGLIAFRYYPSNFIFNNKGCSVFMESSNFKKYIFGFLNSSVCQDILDFMAPTIDYPVGRIASLPIIINESYVDKIDDIVDENIRLVKEDWDNFEISWNFKIHPFLKYKFNSIKKCFKLWENDTINNWNNLKNNELKSNQIFKKIYDVEGENTIEDKNVSITLANYDSDVKSFISYAVGCMFGRYSLDNPGLQFAGGKFNMNNYYKFKPDDDNIIPVLDTEYFEDDIVGRFVEFVKVCFGEETLEENLDFIANALKKKGKSSREIIRNYLLTDFFKDHSKMYKKCPIYWQFDSGKQNAFKCLIYIHRYEPGIVARVRTDYLHKTQKAIEQNLAHCDNIIKNSNNKSEVSRATKDKSKYIKQLDEIKIYDEVLGHMANQHVEIDLDDGIKVNYAKFQNVEISKEGEKTKKINLLKKI